MARTRTKCFRVADISRVPKAVSATFNLPFADETWQSAIARNLEGLSPVSRWRVSSSLLGSPTGAVAYDFPRFLSEIALRLPREIALTATEIAENHTHLPLYTPFLDNSTNTAALNAMLGSGNIHLIIGAGPSRVVRPRRLRLCPHCVRQDRAEHGRAFWHRVHQAPGVLYCPFHKVPLWRSNVDTARAAANEIRSVDESTALTRERFGLQDACLLTLSRDIADVMQSHHEAVGPGKLHRFYISTLDSEGLLTRFGRLAFGALMERFAATFPARILRLLGCGLNPADRDNWLARTLRNPEQKHSPIHHLLVMRLLRRVPRLALREAAVMPPGATPASLAPPRQIRAPAQERLARKRTQWLAAVRARTSGSIRYRHDALYSWLWRHDREWLLANSGRQRRTPPSRRRALNRDAKIAAAIRRAARSLRSRPIPVRISARRLAIEAGHPTILQHNSASLPASSAAILAEAERNVDFACRKIRHAMDTLPKRHRKCRWRVVLAAGLAGSTARAPAVKAMLDQLER